METPESAKASATATDPKPIREPIERILARLKQPHQRDAENAAAEDRERAWAEREQRERFRRQLPPRYASCTFDNWDATAPYQVKVKKLVASWVSSALARGGGLVLFGPSGTGKDHLAVAAIDAYCQRSVAEAKFLNGREFFGEVRDRIGDDSPESALVSRYRQPDLLLVSDPLPPIGDLTAHQSDMLYRVVEARYAAGRITCVTLNVKDDDEADRRLGAATWDRLCHGALKVYCRWASYRKPALEVKP